MKKFTLLQTGLIAIVALVVGLFIGFAIKNFSTSTEDLAGTIGKVDRYRNVKITEDDILLRNELVSDTVKRNQYEKYLQYYYYQSLNKSSAIDQLLSKTLTAVEFDNFNSEITALKCFNLYLEPARVDILNALNMISSLNKNEDVPMLTYLNQAQNAIIRIRNNDIMMLNYMDAITSYMEKNPGEANDELKDTHDILALNVMQGAILAQDKPVLTYLDKKKLMNDKEGMKKLVAEANFKPYMDAHLKLDAEKLGTRLLDGENLQMVIFDMENLNSAWGDIESLGSTLYGDSESLNVLLVGSEQKLGGGLLLDIEKLGGMALILDSEKLGFD